MTINIPEIEFSNSMIPIWPGVKINGIDMRETEPKAIPTKLMMLDCSACLLIMPTTFFYKIN